jgi:hypothetical protein
MALHYLHSLVVYGFGDNPRIVLMTRRSSDTASIGTPVVWTARVPIVPPIAATPRANFQAALEQLPDLTVL